MRPIAAALAQPSFCRPEMPDRFLQNHIKGRGPDQRARRPDITMSTVDALPNGICRSHAHFAVNFLAGEEEPEK